MDEVLSFELSSSFGFFSWEKTKGDNRVSNMFISKTEILGILGGKIGLDGYSQIKFKEEHKITDSNPFFEKLFGLEVSIIPLNKPVFFEDQLIHRNMNHINTKGSLMVGLKGILKPSYKVFIKKSEVSDEIFEKLKLYLENDWSEFLPYMGKNQYPLEITNYKIEELELSNNKNVKIDSIFKHSYLSHNLKTRESKLIKDHFHFNETLRTFKDETGLFLNETYSYSSFDVSLNKEVYETSNDEKIVFI